MVAGDLRQHALNTMSREDASGPLGEEYIDDGVVRRMDEQHRTPTRDPVGGKHQESGDGDDSCDRRHRRRP